LEEVQKNGPKSEHHNPKPNTNPTTSKAAVKVKEPNSVAKKDKSEERRKVVSKEVLKK